MVEATHILKIIIQVSDKATEPLEKVRKVTGLLDSVLKKLNPTIQFNALTMLFAGMAMKRLGDNILGFMIPSMTELTQINDKAARKVEGLYAAFEFLKVSIFETLMSTPLMQAFLEVMIKFAIWMADMVEKYPILADVAVAIGGIMAALGTAATLAFAINQITKVIGLFIGAGSVAEAATEATVAVKGTKTALEAFNLIDLGILLAGVIAIGAALWFIKDTVDRLTTKPDAEKNAPSAQTLTSNPIENMSALNDITERNNQRFSELNGGMQSTIEIIPQVDEKTGKLVSTIKDNNYVMEQAIKNGQAYVDKNGLIQLSAKDLIISHDSVTAAVLREVDAYNKLSKARSAYSSTSSTQNYTSTNNPYYNASTVGSVTGTTVR
jgi:hypothetical protein